MPLKTDLTLRLKPELTKVIGSYTLVEATEFSQVLSLVTGVGANQADKLYYAKPTIVGSATLTLDVATAGGLFDIYGDAFALARLKFLLLVNPSTNPNTINLQRPAANGVPLFLAVSDGEPVHPGGFVVKWFPGATAIPVTAATADLIDIVNTAAGNVTPEIWIGGASA